MTRPDHAFLHEGPRRPSKPTATPRAHPPLSGHRRDALRVHAPPGMAEPDRRPPVDLVVRRRVLVMRETAVRWKTGWPSILLLGAAYGIIEEGLAVKSFFDPTWMDLGTLGVYGRWLAVNWVWAAWLTIYHAAVSIALPIFLLEWV